MDLNWILKIEIPFNYVKNCDCFQKLFYELFNMKNLKTLIHYKTFCHQISTSLQCSNKFSLPAFLPAVSFPWFERFFFRFLKRFLNFLTEIQTQTDFLTFLSSTSLASHFGSKKLVCLLVSSRNCWSSKFLLLFYVFCAFSVSSESFCCKYFFSSFLRL